MPTSEAFSPGAMIVVPFPHSDRLAEKPRPALVISGLQIAKAGYLWIAMITSARNTRMPGDRPIDDLAFAGMSVPSVVRCVKLACIEPVRVVRLAGYLRRDAADRTCLDVRSPIGGP